MEKRGSTYTHKTILLEERYRLGLIALHYDTRCVYEAKELVGNGGYRLKTVDSVIVADLGHLFKASIFGLRRGHCKGPRRTLVTVVVNVEVG